MDKEKLVNKITSFIEEDTNRHRDFTEVDGFIYDMVDEGLIEPEEEDELLELINNIEFKLDILSK